MLSANLDVISAVGELEVSLLRFAQFALQGFFGGGAPQFPACILPVAGPVVFYGVAEGGGVGGTQHDHGIEKVINDRLVDRQGIFGHGDTNGRVYLHEKVVRLPNLDL